MKTLHLILSPKKRWSNSAYLASFSRSGAGKNGIKMHYRGPKDFGAVMEKLREGYQLVMLMPLYVDGIPSHILDLMQKIEQEAKINPFTLKVYSIVNCGFYEGRQCEYALEMVECWCIRCGFTFMGGRGIGAGEMFGVLRLNLIIGILMVLIDFLVSLIKVWTTGTLDIMQVLHNLHPLGGIITIALGILWSLGPWFSASKVGRCAKKDINCGVRYTTVTCCPAFLFVFFASIYWVLRAFITHLTPIWKLFRKTE